MSYIYQLDNGVPILPFFSNENDRELDYLGDFLMYIS